MAPSARFLAFLLIGFCVMSRVFGSLQDGLPRPPNFPDLPTVTYDDTPQLDDANGDPVTCTWYGFANENYEANTGSDCLTVLREALTNATVNPPANLQPYTYYTLKRLIDPATNQSVCYEGCFILGASVPGAAPTPLTAASPSPLASSAPLGSPPVVAPSVPAPGPIIPASTPSESPAAPTPSESPAAAPGGVLESGATSPPAPDSALTGAPPPKPSAGTFLQPATLVPSLVAFVAVFVNLAA